MIVKRITSNDCKPLRHQVLWPHILLEKDCIIDIDSRKDAIHLGVFNEEKLISICSLFKSENEHFPNRKNSYQLRAMATSPNSRGINAGKLVVQEALRVLKEVNSDLLWCNAREVALGFYTKLGFSIEGDFFDVKNIGPHKVMYVKL